MRAPFGRRAARAAAGVAVIAAVAAGTALATSGVLGGPAATNVIQACVKKNGEVRIVASPAQCKHEERSVSWNVQGPQGDPGPKGDTGAAGESVHSAALAVGDRNCPDGGSSFTVGGTTSYACNGAPGADGKNGTSVTSFDGLSGLTCTNGGEAGTISIAYGAGGVATLTCVTGSGGGGGNGGGGGSCTGGPVPNGSIVCDANGNASLVCDPGYADANGNLSDGCEQSAQQGCGSLQHATTSCVNGQPQIAACDQGWYDVNGNPADGCESQLPGCQSIQHDNGVGQIYLSCDNPGIPGDPSTYNLGMAIAAATAWATASGGSQPVTYLCPDGQVVVSGNATTAVAWGYTSATTAGHVRVSTPASTECPGFSDPVWN